MKSRRRIFALLISLVMIVSVVANQHMVVVNAEAAGIDTLIGTEAVQDISAGGTFTGEISTEEYSYVTSYFDDKAEGKGKLMKLTVAPNSALKVKIGEEVSAYKYEGDSLYYIGDIISGSEDEVVNYDNAKTITYYYWLYGATENKYSIEVAEYDDISTLLDTEIKDITEYTTYSGNLSTEKYVYTGQAIQLREGALVKLTLDTEEMIKLTTSDSCAGFVYMNVDGNLKWCKKNFSGECVLANSEEVKTTYYIWLVNFDGDTYEITTSEVTPTLANVVDKAAKLDSGDVTLTNNSDCLTSFWNLSRYFDESSNEGYYVAENFSGYLFYYDIPAMTQTTIKYPADSTIADNIYTYIYDNIEATNFYDILKGAGDSHLVTNATDTTKRVYIFVNEWQMSSNSIDINITDTSIAAEEGKVVFYGYNESWNQNLENFLEENPAYKDKIQFVQLSSSGEWYVDMVEEALAQNNKGTSIIGLDLDYLSDAMERGLLDPVEDIGFDMDSYDNAYDYTIELAETEEGTLGVSYSVSPGGFAYNTAIASEVLGTSNPDEISAMLDTPVEFLQVAEKMKDKGYYMTSGIDILSTYMADRTFNSAETIAFREAIIENGYDTGNAVWSENWTKDMTSGKVFGFFGTNWFMQYVFQYSDDITMDLCTGPLNYPWGGEYFGISTDGSNPEGDEAAKAFLEYFCCNEEVMYELAVERKDIVPNNKNVVAKIIEEGVCNDSKLSRHPFIVWNESAGKVMLGDWESKCVDGKYIICVDENNQIDLAKDGRLALAGFKYNNFSKVTSNGTISKDGVLTVNNLDEVVKYEYVETGDLSGVSVTCYLQFIACDVEEEALNTVTKLVSEGTPVKNANGETVTGWVQVTNGKITGQIDEVSVETNDSSTSINITENRDATGQIVEDASLNVSQNTISEDTLNQSIDVAVNKTKEYAENESTVKITEINAEFNDDTLNTELSKDFFDKLGNNGVSLSITKKVNGEFEYMWYFHQDSINSMDKKELKDVNTKLTIHKGDTYKDNKDIDKITKDDSVNCVLEFSHEGKLPGETTITANLGDKYKDGEKVYYYHYDPITNKLAYVGETEVEGGCAPVKLKHCSDYVITNKLVDNVTMNNTEEKVDETITTSVTDTTNSNNDAGPSTGDRVPIVELIIIMFVAMIGCATLIIKKKTI